MLSLSLGVLCYCLRPIQSPHYAPVTIIVRDQAGGAIPETVVQQIRLWEAELPRMRVKAQEGVLLDEVFHQVSG